MKFKPKTDSYYLLILIFTELIVLAALVLCLAEFTLGGFLIMLFTFIFTSYFIISPFFGYAELRGGELYIKFGFFLKKSIPYSKIRAIEKKRRWYSDSMVSLKMAMDHIDVKYNRFDVVSLSLKDEERFIEELNKKIP